MKSRWISLFLLGGLSGVASATTLNSYLSNREGLSKFAAKSYFPAYQDFTKALNDDPLNPGLHLNIARTFEANEEWDKAERAYRSVLGILPADSSRRFEALFNLAGVLAKNKKIDQALDTYQRALEMDPDSLEVKTNIELLWQGQGGGEGESQGEKGEESKDKKQESSGDKNQDKGQKGPPQKEKPQPKPFNSKELTPQDVKKILDEIKNQEQSIRADENDKGAKQAQPDKDW